MTITKKKKDFKTSLKKKKKVSESAKVKDIIRKKSAQDLFWETYRQHKEEKALEDKFPSKIRSRVWLYATKDNINYPLSTIRSGKWCVFVNKEEHDLWWDRIKQSLLEGNLGEEIKTNTALVHPSASKSKSVIIIYTYDYDDNTDVIRIRTELRKLGITWKIAYKADKATKEGKYRSNGDTKISIYYE